MKRHLIFLLVLLHLFTAPLVAQPLTGGTARKAAGIAPDMVRLSCGIEDTQDLLDDVAQALEHC